MKAVIRIASNKVAGKERSVDATVTEDRDDTDRWLRIDLTNPADGKPIGDTILIHLDCKDLFIEFQDRQEEHFLERLD